MSEMKKEMLVNPALIEAGHKDPFVRDEYSLTLPELIPRIISERGSILNVTEESLLLEILKLEQSDSSSASLLENEDNLKSNTGEEEEEEEGVQEGEEANTGVKSDSLTTEEFLKEKGEILQLLRSALNESSLSLDFISLLISCVRPAAGSISMSPHLRQHVPMGSLNSAHIETQELEKESLKLEYEKEAKVGQGWKLQSLEHSSKILKESSVRLTEEILKEREYWNNICNIVKSNEVLIKMNTGSEKDIGVKFGFGDSGSNYFDKGVGILKKNVKNGEVQFKPIRNNNLERNYKIVKVKILKKIDGELKLISETNVKKLFAQSIKIDDNSIGSEIAKARFYLFEEELFHELIKEATTLIPYQVQVINNKIMVEINDEIIEIEAVSLQEYGDSDDQEEKLDSLKADYVASFLRLMLSQEHKQNINRRFKHPRPLRQDQRHSLLLKVDTNKPLALLLRALIGHSRHNHYIKQVRKICESLIDKYYPQSQNDDTKERPASLKIVKNNNITAKENEKNKFTRCTKVPSSKVIFEIQSFKKEELDDENDTKKGNKKKLRFEISILNTLNFCNIILNVKSFIVGHDKKLIDVNFSEFIDVEDSLDWAIKSS